MAKQTFGHSRDRKTGKVTIHNETMTKSQAKSLTEMPWTKGPGKSPVKRAIRNLFG
jgi:thymidylate kinase